MLKNVLLSLLGFVTVAAAQDLGPLASANVPDSLRLIFGNTTAFSVTVKMEATDKGGKKVSCIMPSAYLNGQARSEIDLTKISAGAQADEAMKMMAAMGLDKMVTISPSQSKLVQIFPGIKAYCEQVIPAAPGKNAAKEEKSTIVDLGKETVDGHPCLKKQLKREGAPATEQVFFWAATDLKNMPVKATLKNGDGAAVLTFSNYNFTKPDAALFTVPQGYKKYNSMQEAMMGAMQNMMPGLPGK